MSFSSSLFFYVPAEAVLISIDDTFFGTDSILRDTATGLDWLDINASTTLGKTYSEVESMLSTDDYAEFRFAQKSELEILVINSGYPGVDSASDYYALDNLIYSIGPTSTFSTGEFPDTMYSWSYLNGMLEATVFEFEDYMGILGATAYLHSIDIGEFTNLRSFNASVGYGYSSSLDFGNTSFLVFPGAAPDSTNDPYRGAFLVRNTPGFVPIPEPSTFILLGGGLAGLAFYARRRRKE